MRVLPDQQLQPGRPARPFAPRGEHPSSATIDRPHLRLMPHTDPSPARSGDATTSRPSHPTLRFVTDDDASFLYELFVAVRGPAFASLSDDMVGPLFEQQYRAQQASYGATYPLADHHVVELGGDPIGQIRVDRAATSIVLVDISLLPMARNYGIGTHLIESLVDESDYTGMPIELSVATDNPARRLYERLGFVETGADALYARMVRRPGGEPAR